MNSPRVFVLRVTLDGTPAAVRTMLGRFDDAIEAVLVDSEPPKALLFLSTDMWREEKIVVPR